MVLSTADKTLVMGVLNVTPDSFSDGGRFFSERDAIDHGFRMIEEGAEIIDVGGESTRPGADRIDPNEEIARTLPVIKTLARAGAVLSIDTMNAATARAAINAGASIINDVSGGLADPEMASTAAALSCGFIAMHWRGHSKQMHEQAVYSDVVREVVSELRDRVDALVNAGVKLEQMAIDPGLGFAKDAEHNWALLRGVDELQGLGLPLLIGASRKRFLGGVAGDDELARDIATATISALMAQKKVWAVRVHNVAATKQAIAVMEQMR